MPRVATKPKPQKGRRPFKKGEMCRALQAAYVEVNGESYYVRTGDRFLSDHPAVQAVPNAFLPDDCPTDEVVLWLPEFDTTQPVDVTFPRIAAPEPIPEHRRVICVVGLGDFARYIEPGMVVDGGREPFVRHRPECFSIFRPLTDEDVERLSADADAAA